LFRAFVEASLERAKQRHPGRYRTELLAEPIDAPA
jgi:hypothetical protein